LIAGRVDLAASSIAAAELVAREGDAVIADLAIARGDLALAERQDSTAAEESYGRALQVARTAGLRMAEIEAATRLASLRAGTPREEESVGLVRELLDSFTEGHSTPQLAAASAMILDKRKEPS
jgi:hypothetical protein